MPLDLNTLLSAAPRVLPLNQEALTPNLDVCDIQLEQASSLFPNARDPEIALMGLFLRLGCWSQSHSIAQDIDAVEGSYWHAILHRIEPDSSNAKYWFRRVGAHPIFPQLHESAADILAANGPAHWQLKSTWDPFLFVDWCEEGRVSAGPARDAAVQIQMVEWQLLFDWCANHA